MAWGSLLGYGAQIPDKRPPILSQTLGPMMATVVPNDNIQKIRDNRRGLSKDHRRNSVLPMQWRVVHSSRWMAQVAASELSLVAFILLLVMVFSKQWLCPSASRFYKRYPKDVSNRIHISVHVMSMGLLYVCTSKSCSYSETWKDSFKIWINQPVFGVAKIIFSFALAMGLTLTIWLHLPYLPSLQRAPCFGLIGTILSFCEVTLIFSTLLLFPINLWIFEVKRNVSIPIGWSYFIGWLVLILYVTCVLCYLNNRAFWSVILSHSSSTVSCHNSSNSPQDSLSQQIISDTSHEEVLATQCKNSASTESYPFTRFPPGDRSSDL